MKKIVCILIVLAMLFTAVACDIQGGDSYKETQGSGITQPTEATSDSGATKESEIAAAKSAYDDLKAVNIVCETIMNSIYGAWYFSIYEEDEYLEFAPTLKAFSNRTALKESIISAAVEKYIEDSNGILEKTDLTRTAVLCATSSAIKIVTSSYTELYSDTSDYLDSAKEKIKSLTTEYKDITGYSTLKAYYSEVSSYFEFCKVPTGSFKQLSTTIDNYETNCNKYKNDLSIVLD